MSITHPVPTATASPASGTSSQIDAQGWIAYIDQDQTLHVVQPDGSGDRALYQFDQTAKSGWISLEGWSVNGRFLAFGVWVNDKRSIFVWDSHDESGLIELKDTSAPWEGIRWNPREEHLFATVQSISVSEQTPPANRLEIWNVLDASRVIAYEEAGAKFEWNPDGNRLFFDMPYMDTKAAGQKANCPTMPIWITYDGIYIYDIETGESSIAIPARENPLVLDSVLPNGRELIFHEMNLFCTGMDGPCMAGLPQKVSLDRPEAWTDPIGSDCAWSPDGKWVACGGNMCVGDPFQIFDETRKSIHTFSQFTASLPDSPYRKSWSPNNQKLAITEIGFLDTAPKTYAWDSISAETLQLPGNAAYLDWAPDGRYYVASMDPENNYQYVYTVFDYETKREVAVLGKGNAIDQVDWQPRGLLEAPANVTIRPDAGKQTYIIEWDALNDMNVSYEVRYAFQEITDSTWNGIDSYELRGDTQLGNNRIALSVTIQYPENVQPRSKIFIGVRAVSEKDVYSPISNTPWIVDWGFRPHIDGYVFSNSLKGIWINNPEADFTVDDFRRLYGDEHVCSKFYPFSCQLTFSARDRYDKDIRILREPRCLGMSITSEKNYLDEPDLFESVSNFNNLFEEAEIEQVRRTIAYYHVQQNSNPSKSANLADKNLLLGKKVDKLVTYLEGNIGAVISFKISAANWHAVTPIAVESSTNNQYRFWVYDSNYSDMIRPMYVNLDDNFLSYKWQDDVARTKENEEKSVNLTVGADIHVTPLNLYSKRVEYITKFNIVQILSASYLQILDDANNLTGFHQNEYVNQIPGAEIIPVVNSFDSIDEPIYWLPDGARYTVNINPVSSESEGDSLFSWIGKTFTIAIIRDRLTQPEQLIVGDGGKDLSYMPRETGLVSLSFSQTETDYETRLELQQYAFQAGDQLKIVYDASEGDYLVTYSGNENITGNLTMTLHDDQGEHVLQEEGFQLQPENTHHVQIGSWSERGIVQLGMDKNGDGQVDQWQTARGLSDGLLANKGLIYGGALLLVGGLTLIVGVLLLKKKGTIKR